MAEDNEKDPRSSGMERPLGSREAAAFPQSLQAVDFKDRPALTREFVAGCETWLDAARFHDKAAAIWPQGAWLAMRAHPGALWADLAQLDPVLLPGRAGVCLGDAHFDNFGYIQIPGQPSFLFGPNDLDDGGVGMVALDALKYFAVLSDQPRLQGQLDRLLTHYVAVLGDPGLEQRVPAKLWPDPQAVAKKKLAKYVADGKIRPESLPFQSAPLGEPAREYLSSALRTVPQLRGSVLVDAVDQHKLSGGSYGGERHWVLIDRGAHGGRSGLDLIEFKSLMVPATAADRQSQPMTQAQRIEFLKLQLWHTSSDADYFVVRLGELDFLLRSRLHKASLAPLELDDPKDVADLLTAQVSLLAAQHRPALAEVPRDRLLYWLHESARQLVARWRQLISEAQSWLAPPA